MLFPSFDLPQPPDESGQALQRRRTNTDVDMNANLKSPLGEIQRYQALEKREINSFPLLGVQRLLGWRSGNLIWSGLDKTISVFNYEDIKIVINDQKIFLPQILRSAGIQPDKYKEKYCE